MNSAVNFRVRPVNESDQDRLITLRMSVARIAQAIGITDGLAAKDGDAALYLRCRDVDLGWNLLCAEIIERAKSQ